MQITNEIVEAACKAYEQQYGTSVAIRRDAMRAALEGALEALESPLQHDIDRHLKILSEKEACIEDLAGALKPFAELFRYYQEECDVARATLERWGLK